MDLFNDFINWEKVLQPILIQYRNKKHPLNYQNLYQLIVMVILSAQDSDENINKIAPNFFQTFPDLKSLSESKIEKIIPQLYQVKHYENKAQWIHDLGKTFKEETTITLSLKELTNIKGIGRKSANVIMKEENLPFEGIMVDLHVLRVVPRIGIIKPTKDGIKAERLLMAILPREIWNEIGMAISFLGREICRPTPKCSLCLINSNCNYFKHKN